MPFIPSGASDVARAKLSVKELARMHTRRAIKRLAKLTDIADCDAVRAHAAIALLDRGWGKPTQEISGPDGGPLVIHTRSFDADDPPAS